MRATLRINCSILTICYEYTRRDHAGFCRSQRWKNGKYRYVIIFYAKTTSYFSRTRESDECYRVESVYRELEKTR